MSDGRPLHNHAGPCRSDHAPLRPDRGVPRHPPHRDRPGARPLGRAHPDARADVRGPRRAPGHRSVLHGRAVPHGAGPRDPRPRRRWLAHGAPLRRDPRVAGCRVLSRPRGASPPGHRRRLRGLRPPVPLRRRRPLPGPRRGRRPRGRRIAELAAADLLRRGPAATPAPRRPADGRRPDPRRRLRRRGGDRRARRPVPGVTGGRGRPGARLDPARAGAHRRRRPRGSVRGATRRRPGADRGGGVRRRHRLPRRARDRRGRQGRGLPGGRSGALAGRLVRHLRRGLPRNRRGATDDADEVRGDGPVVRADLGEPDRHPDAGSSSDARRPACGSSTRRRSRGS